MKKAATPVSKQNSQNTNQDLPTIIKSKNKILFLIVAFVLLFSTLIGAVGYLSYQNKNITSQLQSKSNCDAPKNVSVPTNCPVTELDSSLVPDQFIRVYPSLDGGMSFYVYESGSFGECLYGIIDKQGYTLEVSDLLDLNTITCNREMGRISTSFISWGADNTFVVNEEPGELKIVNVRRSIAESFEYDPQEYVFIAVNTNLDSWLFKKNQDNEDYNNTYTVLDRNKNVVLDNIFIESNDRGVMYDEANDGFLFISWFFYEGGKKSVKLQFLSADTLQLRTILSTEPKLSLGSGCTSEYLISVTGEIILTPGCTGVGEEYISEDGYIHIKL